MCTYFSAIILLFRTDNIFLRIASSELTAQQNIDKLSFNLQCSDKVTLIMIQ